MQVVLFPHLPTGSNEEKEKECIYMYIVASVYDMIDCCLEYVTRWIWTN